MRDCVGGIHHDLQPLLFRSPLLLVYTKSQSRPATLNPLRQLFPRLSSRLMSTTMSPPTKRARTTPLLGTHSGTFHCDEALAVFLLRLLPAYGPTAPLVRSRDPAVLEECTVVVDVGGVYDAQALRFDHHQRGFEEVFGSGFSTKLSSAGLVYK